MRKALYLLAGVLVFLALQMAPARTAWAVACVTAPNTPVENGSSTIDCNHAYGAANTAASSWAASYCAGQCGRVCLYNFVGGNCIVGGGTYYASGYGTFGCAAISGCTPP